MDEQAILNTILETDIYQQIIHNRFDEAAFIKCLKDRAYELEMSKQFIESGPVNLSDSFIKKGFAIIRANPHRASTSPCKHCKEITAIIKRPFWCTKRALDVDAVQTLVDRQGKTFAQIAESTGKTEKEIEGLYKDERDNPPSKKKGD